MGTAKMAALDLRQAVAQKGTLLED